MKKFLFVVLVLTTALVFVFTLTACGNAGAKQETPSGETGGGTLDPVVPIEPDLPTDPELLEFSGVTLPEIIVDYDGQSHALSVAGAPDGTDISYQNNDKIDAGSYNVTATLNKTGYRTLRLKSTLTINPISVSGVEFKSKIVEYDQSSHRLEIVGTLPEDCTVTYSGGTGAAKNEAAEVGSHPMTATISGKNHITLELTATLTIRSKEELLFSYRSGNTVYFQNP